MKECGADSSAQRSAPKTRRSSSEVPSSSSMGDKQRRLGGQRWRLFPPLFQRASLVKCRLSAAAEAQRWRGRGKGAAGLLPRRFPSA
nr:hypothetical protein Itr_chr06CG14900 [Ipomoea trifida]